MSKGEKTPHSIIAVAKEDGRFKAVEVRRQDNHVEIVWTRSLPAEKQTWAGFATECGVAPSTVPHEKTGKRSSPAVVGLDSTGVAFYRINVPTVDGQETAAIVKMQAESLLPLPPDQIEVAWRTNPSSNGSMDITIAAARKEHIERFATGVKDLRPHSILLSCEGTAKAWQSLFAGHQPETLLVSIGVENTQVCLVQNGLVTRAGVLDMGMSALAPAVEAASGVMDRFSHDLQLMLASFGWDGAGSWPLFVLSDGSEAVERIVGALNAAGMPAKSVASAPQNVKLPAGFEPREVYEYRTPLGLALIALDRSATTLNLFDRVLQEQEQQKAATAWRSVVLAAAAAVAMLVALLATVYFTDLASAKRWDSLVKQPDFQASLQQQALVKTVARHRPDLLELLTVINAGQNEGVVLDTFHFQKGQPVSVTGQADNMEQMWKFQANLRERKEIKSADIMNATPDAKTNKTKFTIAFQFKEFTKKEAAL